MDGYRLKVLGCGLSKTNNQILFFMAKGHIFYRKVFFHFIMCGSSRTKSDVMVAAGRYELVHISTDATNTSRLPQADTHNEMYFFSIDNHWSPVKAIMHFCSFTSLDRYSVIWKRGLPNVYLWLISKLNMFSGHQ